MKRRLSIQALRRMALRRRLAEPEPELYEKSILESEGDRVHPSGIC